MLLPAWHSDSSAHLRDRRQTQRKAQEELVCSPCCSGISELQILQTTLWLNKPPQTFTFLQLSNIGLLSLTEKPDQATPDQARDLSGTQCTWEVTSADSRGTGAAQGAFWFEHKNTAVTMPVSDLYPPRLTSQGWMELPAGQECRAPQGDATTLLARGPAKQNSVIWAPPAHRDALNSPGQ